MRIRKSLVAVLVMSLSLTGCAGTQGNKQGAGTLIGGAGGALLGSQVGKGHGRLAATAIGTLIGAAIGNDIGASMDELDRIKADRAFNQATQARVGSTINWNNPENGHSGSVKVVRDGNRSDGQYCREFQNTVIIGGKPQQAYGTACRQPNGNWQIVQ